ncbi:MAG TPA: hypothetical protein VFZ42_08630 [Chitinophagaceae bacterium]
MEQRRYVNKVLTPTRLEEIRCRWARGGRQASPVILCLQCKPVDDLKLRAPGWFKSALMSYQAQTLKSDFF